MTASPPLSRAGAFAWLASRGRTAAIVRQISNPMAGTDANLLALAGAGCLGNKAFGFASCGRAYGASEGINVLVEVREVGGWRWDGVDGIGVVEVRQTSGMGVTQVTRQSPARHFSLRPTCNQPHSPPLFLTTAWALYALPVTFQCTRV